MEAAGVQQPSTEFLDLSALTPTKQRISPVDRAMTPQQARDFQSGMITPPPASLSDLDHAIEMPNRGPAPEGAPAPMPDPAVPAPNADIRASDSDNVRRRIGRVYGQWKTEQEKNASLEARLQATEQQLSQYRAAPAPAPAPQQYQQQQPPQQGYDSYGVTQTPQPELPVSRAEFAQALQEQARFLSSQMQLAHAHTVSRRDAEMDFPDVFSNPELKEAAAHIYQSEPFLQRDPFGPYKAAALARGMAPDNPPAGGPVPTAARKAQLSGFGSSSAEGAAQPVNDQSARYYQALTHAKRTGRTEDYSRARQIQMGMG